MASRDSRLADPERRDRGGRAPKRDSLGPQRPKPEQTQPTSEERSVTKKRWPGNYYAKEARANGLSSQAAENSCDSMPMATLERAMKLANAMKAVSSTRPAAPSALSS